MPPSLLLKNEVNRNIKINPYILRGKSINGRCDIEALFYLASSKPKYRRYLLENINNDDETFNSLLRRANLIYKLNLYPPGTVFELWTYFLIKKFFETYNIDGEVYRNLNIEYNGKSISEIDVLAKVNNKIYIFECKNKNVTFNILLKFYGIVKLLKLDRGVIATTKIFCGNLDKEDIAKELNIFILDRLEEKDENRIFKELRIIFEI
ncbi:hypothetical protein, partial [Methanocaldococcus sp.]